MAEYSIKNNNCRLIDSKHKKQSQSSVQLMDNRQSKIDTHIYGIYGKNYIGNNKKHQNKQQLFKNVIQCVLTIPIESNSEPSVFVKNAPLAHNRKMNTKHHKDENSNLLITCSPQDFAGSTHVTRLCAEKELLMIVSHGSQPNRSDNLHLFAGFPPRELASIVLKWLPYAYEGEIYLNGCDTASTIGDDEKTSYIYKFATELREISNANIKKLGFFTVKGNKGLTQIIDDKESPYIGSSAVLIEDFNHNVYDKFKGGPYDDRYYLLIDKLRHRRGSSVKSIVRIPPRYGTGMFEGLTMQSFHKK